jgi:MFS family permease
MKVTSRLRRLLPDATPWRTSRDFRLLWSSGTITTVGSVFALVALPLQIKEITGSPFAVGAIGLVELVPTVVFGLYGGVLADSLDRRLMTLLTEIGLGLLTLLLLVNTLGGHPALWPLYVVAGCVAALQGLQQPSLEAILPRVVPNEQIPAAIAFSAVRWSVAGIAGPPVAGVVIATAGLTVAYAVDALTFLLSVLLLFRVRPVPASAEAEPPSWRAMGAGVRYASRRPELVGTYLVDLAETFLALPLALFPFLADGLHARWALGLLYAASGVGGLIVTSTSGWTGRVHRHGRLVLAGGAVWGAAMIGVGFGYGAGLWLVLVLLVVAGAGHMVSDLFRSFIWNQSIPDRLRGRLAGIEMLTGSMGPQLGDVRAGAVGARVGAGASIWTGGVACVAAVGVVGVVVPRLWRYDARTDPHVIEARAEAVHR